MKNHSIYLSRTTCDAIKLIAALFVLSAHMASVTLGPAYGSTHWLAYATATQNGYIGVAVFFFRSGFGLMESEKRSHLTLASFISRRFAKVYVPVLLVTAIWLPISQLITPPILIGCNTVFYNLLWGFADPVMWYVRVLIPLYAAFYLMTLIFSRRRSATAAVWLLYVVCMAYTLWSIANDSIRDHSVPMFALGVLASYYRQRGILFFTVITSVSAIVMCASTVLLTSHPITGMIHVGFDNALIIAMVAILSARKAEWKLPTVLTAISFDLYLVHFKILEVTSRYLPLGAFLFVSVAASFIIAIAFRRLREPATNFVSRLLPA